MNLTAFQIREGLLSLLAFAMLSSAQQITPPDGSDQQQEASSQNRQQAPSSQDPPIIEDGGYSFEPMYWLNRAQPALRGGAANTGFSDSNYPGNSNAGLGGAIGVPAGRSNTLRFAYFRVQGNANTTETQNATIFSESYVPGDYLISNYLLQSAKISWDYLSYTWDKPSGKIRLKTLYELQYTTISTNFEAPFKTVTTDSSGNTDYNEAHGAKNLFFPTFGLELEQALGHHIRWELKGSGFGLPHRADIWDTEASLAFRVRQLEVLGGEKAFHFKDSPRGSEYFTDTLAGAYIGLRYYWGSKE